MPSCWFIQGKACIKFQHKGHIVQPILHEEGLLLLEKTFFILSNQNWLVLSWQRRSVESEGCNCDAQLSFPRWCILLKSLSLKALSPRYSGFHRWSSNLCTAYVSFNNIRFGNIELKFKILVIERPHQVCSVLCLEEDGSKVRFIRGDIFSRNMRRKTHWGINNDYQGGEVPNLKLSNLVIDIKELRLHHLLVHRANQCIFP